jgi:SLT domain-containing protein
MEAALRYTGINPTPALVDLGLRRMNQESGGNPMAINKTDINAQRGDPSIGLMQNIGSAFPQRAKELASRGIYDGFANIVASIRYTLGQYGSLEAGWGRKGGY